MTIVHPRRLIPLALLAFSLLAPAEPVRVLIVDGFPATIARILLFARR